MHSPEKVTAIQLIDSLYRGGAQKVALEIVKALPDVNHVVCYWADNKDLEAEFLSAGARLVPIPFSGMHSLPACLRFVSRLANEVKPRYVHGHMFVPNLLSRWVKQPSVKTFCTFHGECFEQGGPKGFITRKLERMTIGRTDKIVAVSEYIASYVRSKIGLDREITVIHNFGGAPTTRVKSRTGALRLVTASNNQPYKNYPLVIEAFDQLRDPSVTLDIFGQGMHDLQEEVKRRAIPNITFHGSVPNVADRLEDYDVYLAPSKGGEGFSLSLLEAMNAGLTVVASDIMPFREALDDAGIYFRNNDAADMVRAIRELKANPRMLAEKPAALLARARLFSYDAFRRKVRNLYEVEA